jgi:GNAT superfamily N-acetyltransferase
MNYEVTFQLAAVEHADGISAVIRDAIKRVNAKDYPPAEIERLMQNFSTDKVRGLMQTRRTWIAFAKGLVIGTGALQGTEVKSVFVSPDWHRKGIGAALMRTLEKTAEREGLRILEVSSSLSATDFYSALGYIEKSRKFYGEEETVLMSKTIVQLALD